MAVTIKDVAREARVSVASVSRALNGSANVTEITRRRIIGVAERLRYVPHSAARSLITRRTQTIGVVLPDLYGEFFSELMRGIDLVARARGLHLLVSSSHGHPAEAGAALRAMQRACRRRAGHVAVCRRRRFLREHLVRRTAGRSDQYARRVPIITRRSASTTTAARARWCNI